MSIVYIVIVLFSVVLVWFYRRYRRSRTVEELRKRGLSKKWQDYLENNVSLYRRMPREFRSQLHSLINVFLNDKQFIACDGLQMQDKIRLTIAAQACMLLLRSADAEYPNFHTVMVYPTAYYAKEQVSDGLVVSQELSLRAGESWERGIVVLSWEDVEKEGRGGSPGHNVVIHEFAHRLDQQNTSSEGVPLLDSTALYQQWAQVLGSEFEILNEELNQGQDTLIDPYAATSPAEFFAVVTELFFELPALLKEHHAALYAQLSGYYRLDTVGWDNEQLQY